MLVKSGLMTAALALGLYCGGHSLPANAAGNAASEATAAGKQITVNRNSTFTLIHGGHGGHGGMSGGGHAHSGGGHSHMSHSFANHGFARHHFRHRFHRRFFFVGPYYDGDYGGGSCYWNCRQHRGPRYCRLYAENYCY